MFVSLYILLLFLHLVVIYKLKPRHQTHNFLTASSIGLITQISLVAAIQRYLQAELNPIIIKRMNIRKAKKRRIATFPRNQEEIAKDKLFEISYLNEEKFVDQSRILAQEFTHADITLPLPHRISNEMQNLVEKNRSKTYQLKTYESDDRMSKLSRTIYQQRQLHSKTQSCIFNAVNSNQVFVGNKLINTVTTKFDNPISRNSSGIERNKRVETMPVIRSNTLGLNEQVNSQKYYLHDERKDDHVRDRKFLKIFFSLAKSRGRQHYVRLKERIRKDLFSTLHIHNIKAEPPHS